MAYPFPPSKKQFDFPHQLRDRDGGLWLGSSTGGGLVHIHQGRTDTFASSDGLSGDQVSSLFEDREGNIWVATTDGLDRFRDISVASFSVKQGLSTAQADSVLAAKDGSIWIGTADGVNRWNHGRTISYRGTVLAACTRSFRTVSSAYGCRHRAKSVTSRTVGLSR